MLLSDVGSPSLFPLLCKEVIPSTNKWRAIGIQLQLQPTEINRMTLDCHDEENCFIKVLEAWQRKGSPPFTWETIISVLECESVSERALAMNLKSKYLTHDVIVIN